MEQDFLPVKIYAKERTTREVTESQHYSITVERIFILEVGRNKLDSLPATFF